jgi:hypothetical protein
MTFSKEQQQHARKLFMKEWRQEACSASCNADYISKHFDKLMGEYERLKKKIGRSTRRRSCRKTTA